MTWNEELETKRQNAETVDTLLGPERAGHTEVVNSQPVQNLCQNAGCACGMLWRLFKALTRRKRCSQLLRLCLELWMLATWLMSLMCFARHLNETGAAPVWQCARHSRNKLVQSGLQSFKQPETLTHKVRTKKRKKRPNILKSKLAKHLRMPMGCAAVLRLHFSLTQRCQSTMHSCKCFLEVSGCQKRLRQKHI